MKNLHLLSTDKPSVLILRQDCKLFFTGYGGQLGKIHGLRKDVPQNIYITSDEKLPYDDSIFDTGAFYHKDALGTVHIITKNTFKPNPNFCKRIILTTDQDLIADGVQAIENEFLEWFVKNPSCEFVEIVKVPYHDESGYSYLLGVPQKETLEEAKKYAELSYYGDEVDAFIAGTKWQAKRMYSELEVDELVYNVIGQYGRHYGIMIDGAKINKWFEQFKKK